VRPSGQQRTGIWWDAIEDLVAAQGAIEDLVAAQSDWFEKVRRFFPGLLPRRNDATERKLRELLVDQDTKGPLLDRILQAVREAPVEHFELARQVLGARFQLCLGSLLGLLARRELGIAATDEEEVALELCKKELRCLPVYAAYFVYLAARRPKELEKLKQAMQQALKQGLGMALD
jgi:hypothetical protein